MQPAPGELLEEHLAVGVEDAEGDDVGEAVVGVPDDLDVGNRGRGRPHRRDEVAGLALLLDVPGVGLPPGLGRGEDEGHPGRRVLATVLGLAPRAGEAPPRPGAHDEEAERGPAEGGGVGDDDTGLAQEGVAVPVAPERGGGVEDEGDAGGAGGRRHKSHRLTGADLAVGHLEDGRGDAVLRQRAGEGVGVDPARPVDGHRLADPRLEEDDRALRRPGDDPLADPAPRVPQPREARSRAASALGWTDSSSGEACRASARTARAVSSRERARRPGPWSRVGSAKAMSRAASSVLARHGVQGAARGVQQAPRGGSDPGVRHGSTVVPPA